MLAGAAAARNLGLPAEPNVGEICCHASASTFKSFYERMNWLNVKTDKDVRDKARLAAGGRPKSVKDKSLDPVVSYGPELAPTSKYIWDTLEDMEAKDCIAKGVEIDAWRP